MATKRLIDVDVVSSLDADAAVIVINASAVEQIDFEDLIDASTLASTVSTATSDITTLQSDVSDAQGDITTLQSSMTTAEGDIDDLESDVSALQTTTAALADNLAAEYDSTATYESGDYCLYQDVLYECTADTTGDFDATCWSATSIDSVLGTLKNSVSDGKALLATAITDAGITTASTDSFQTMADNIDLIPVYTKVKSVSSADVITLTDAIAKQLAALETTIELTQSGSGTPSPDNVRPITGWTQARVFRTGTNLFSQDDTRTNMYIPSSVEVGTVVSPSSSSSIVFGKAAYLKAGVEYTLNWTYGDEPISAASKYAVICDDDDVILEKFVCWRNNGTAVTFTPTYSGWLWATCDGNSSEPVLVYGSSARTYADYDGDTATVDLSSAGTVYGGTLNVKTGELTVTHAYRSLYDASITIAQASTKSPGVYRYQLKGFSGLEVPESASVATSALSNVYEGINADSTYTAASSGFAVRSSNTVYVYDEDHNSDSADDFRTYLASIDAYAVFPLATPVTYTLTGADLETLAGDNQIYSDCGQVALTYWIA